MRTVCSPRWDNSIWSIQWVTVVSCIDNGSTGGRLWLGLVSIIWNATVPSIFIDTLLQGTGLLRVYDMDHYYLESDTKITDCTHRQSTRLVWQACCKVLFILHIQCQSSFLLVNNFVWAGSLNRTIYILDSDTSTGVWYVHLCMHTCVSLNLCSGFKIEQFRGWPKCTSTRQIRTPKVSTYIPMIFHVLITCFSVWCGPSLFKGYWSHGTHWQGKES